MNDVFVLVVFELPVAEELIVAEDVVLLVSVLEQHGLRPCGVNCVGAVIVIDAAALDVYLDTVAEIGRLADCLVKG